MPMPWTYRQASREWAAFLQDAKDALGTPTDHSTFTAVEGVLRAFRARLDVEQAIAFAQILPAVLRALFVANWRIAPPLPAGTRADWTREAKALRANHNIAPDHVVMGTALAVRKSVHYRDFEEVLATLPPFAVEYWRIEGQDPAGLGPRLV